MTYRRDDPEQWLPTEEKPDDECNLLELWSRYCRATAKYRRFRNSEETIGTYTNLLYQIRENPLLKKPAWQMDAYDCWAAIVSVRSKENGGLYSESTLRSRLIVLKDLFEYLEAKDICSNPLSVPPWGKEGEDGVSFDLSADELKEKILRSCSEKILIRSLIIDVEQKLLLAAEKCIEEDGRWLGLAIYLLLGVRPSEGRALTFGDIEKFSKDSTRAYMNVFLSTESDGSLSLHMKTPTSHRRIPIPVELQVLIDRRIQFIKDATKLDDIDHLPIICFKNDFSRHCMRGQLGAFMERQMRLLLDPQTVMLMALAKSRDEIELVDADNDNDKEASVSLSTYTLRRNFATKMYDTTLNDTQVRLLMGHKLDEACDDPYGEDSLYEMLLKMDGRVILPELHAGWCTELRPNEMVELVDRGYHCLSAKFDAIGKEETTIHICLESLSAGDDLVIEFLDDLPAGVKIDCQVWYMPAKTADGTRRVNTEASRWDALERLERIKRTEEEDE